MKKFFSLVAALCVSFALSAATSVTFGFADATEYGYTNPANGEFTQIPDGGVLTKDSVSLTVNFATGNGFRFFAHTNTGVINLRGYVNSTLTVACPEGKVISTIEIAGQNLTDQYVTVSEGAYSSGVWVGEAAQVTFNIIKSTVQMNTLIVTYGESGEGPAPKDTIGVSEARARIDAGELGACYVYGVVATNPTDPGSYGNIIFWMTDTENATDSLEGYRITGIDGASFPTKEDIPFSMGDTVLIYANGLMLYNNSIYEINGGNLVEVLGYAPYQDVDFQYADVRYAGTENDTTSWIFTFSHAEETLPGATFMVTNRMTRGIAGRYNAVVEGAYMYMLNDTVVELFTSFAMSAAYAGQGDNYNLYDIELMFVTDSGMYRFNGQLEIAGYTSDYTEPYALTDDQPYIPQPGDTLTCAQAKEYTLSLENGASTDFEVTVIGYVTDNFNGNVSKGQQSFWLDDVKDSGKKTFEGYYCNLPDKTTPVPVGAKLAITGKLTNYNGTTAEMKNGSITYIEGEPTPEERELNILPVPDNAITVAEALEIGASINDGDVTEEEYTVVGYICKVQYQTKNDSASWYMLDTQMEAEAFSDFEAYKCAIDNSIMLNDYVFVTGHITKYVGEKYTTIEISKGEAHFAEAPSAIENVTVLPAALDLNQPMYNTLGQPVDASFRGIVIQNGKKYLLY